MVGSGWPRRRTSGPGGQQWPRKASTELSTVSVYMSVIYSSILVYSSSKVYRNLIQVKISTTHICFFKLVVASECLYIHRMQAVVKQPWKQPAPCLGWETRLFGLTERERERAKPQERCASQVLEGDWRYIQTRFCSISCPPKDAHLETPASMLYIYSYVYVPCMYDVGTVTQGQDSKPT